MFLPPSKPRYFPFHQESFIFNQKTCLAAFSSSSWLPYEHNLQYIIFNITNFISLLLATKYDALHLIFKIVFVTKVKKYSRNFNAFRGLTK